MTMNILPPAEPGNPNGNMTSGAGRTFGYTSYNKPASISQGATTLQFDHDPEHQRYRQLGPSGMTVYVAGSGVLGELSGLGTNTHIAYPLGLSDDPPCGVAGGSRMRFYAFGGLALVIVMSAWGLAPQCGCSLVGSSALTCGSSCLRSCAGAMG